MGIPIFLKDYYDLLGIPPKATPNEIKDAFMKKAREYHPDTHPNNPLAQSMMRSLNEAREVLLNPEMRSNYDIEYRGETEQRWRAAFENVLERAIAKEREEKAEIYETACKEKALYERMAKKYEAVIERQRDETEGKVQKACKEYRTKTLKYSFIIAGTAILATVTASLVIVLTKISSLKQQRSKDSVVITHLQNDLNRAKEDLRTARRQKR